MKLFFYLVFLVGASLYAKENTFLIIASNPENDRFQLDYIHIQKRKINPLLKELDYFDISAQSKKIVYKKKEIDNLFLGEIRTDTMNELKLLESKINFPFTSNDIFFTLSSDGAFLIWARCNQKEKTSSLFIMELATSSFRKICDITGFPYKMTCSPDNKMVAFYLKTKTINILIDDYAEAYTSIKTGHTVCFPQSLPTRPTPMRTWGPRWSNNSKYIFYEGRLHPESPYFVLLADTDRQKIYQCIGGYWFQNEVLVIKPIAQKLKLYLNSLNSILNDSLDNKFIGEINTPAFNVSYLQQDKNRLYFQTPFNVIAFYDFNNHKKVDILQYKCGIAMLCPLVF